MKLVWKLLRKNINKSQLIGFFFANIIGLIIVLLAFQLYVDLKPIVVGKDTLFVKDYLTISKDVTLLSSFSSKAGTFTPDDIKNIENQPFIKKTGAFTASKFRVYAGINSQSVGIGLNTEMFFESVPNQFIDINPSDWDFSPTTNNIPIILPQDYLDLYNFGFAQANGTPKVTEKLVSLVSMNIVISGNGKSQQMNGRIVGFSSRINTILVPNSFMNWANKEFGSNTETYPSRLIVEVNNIGDPALSKFFSDNHYIISGDKTKSSKIAFFLQIVLIIVAIVGSIICALSFIILLLSIYLLLEKNMDKLMSLRLIGYRKSKVVLPYEFMAITLNILTFIIAIISLYFVRQFYLEALSSLFSSEVKSTMSCAILLGAGITIILSFFNILMIRRKIK